MNPHYDSKNKKFPCMRAGQEQYDEKFSWIVLTTQGNQSFTILFFSGVSVDVFSRTFSTPP